MPATARKEVPPTTRRYLLIKETEKAIFNGVQWFPKSQVQIKHTGDFVSRPDLKKADGGQCEFVDVTMPEWLRRKVED